MYTNATMVLFRMQVDSTKQ